MTPNHNDIKLVCFDLNSTLITENTWQLLNAALGITKQEDLAMLNQYQAGALTYQEWQVKIKTMYIERKKAYRATIEKVVLQHTYMEGAVELLEYLHQKGYQTALVSGAIDTIVEAVSKELNIPYFYANNHFVYDANNYLSDIITTGDEKTIKVDYLKDLLSKLGMKPRQCACIGDGSNEIELFKYTGNGITFRGSNLENLAWKTVSNLSDIREIL